jgi:hypothetical protein
MAQACRLHAAALKQKFSALDYLPYPGSPKRLLNKKTIDWKSLMIYPSGAGGIGSATFDGVDNRMPILKKQDGSLISVVTKPSPEDIKGLKALYSVKTGLRGKFKSLFDKDSKHRDAAANIAGKTSDCR